MFFGRFTFVTTLFMLSACGPKISDRRIEKATFAGGEVLINDSHIETDSICFRHCEPQRRSTLSIQLAAGRNPEEVGELRPTVRSGCCLLESVKPVRYDKSGELQAITFGPHIFTKWDWDSAEKRKWLPWTIQVDQETNYFLRHFPCKTMPIYVQSGSSPCNFADGNPYREIKLDLSVPVARLSRTTPESGWPNVLVYSAPARANWQFDFERTIQENPNLSYRPFPTGLRVEARFLQVKGELSGNSNSPEEFTRQFPPAQVALQRMLPISTTTWTNVSIPVAGGRYSYEFRAAYGDTDPDWITVYHRFSGGWKGYNTRFLRIGEWMALGASGHADKSITAGFIRVVRQ